MKDAAAPDEAKCPVDHQSRAAWLAHAQAASAAEQAAHPPAAAPSPSPDAQCPVDHTSRATWLDHARAAPSSADQHPPPPITATTAPAPAPATASSSWASWLPFTRTAAPAPAGPTHASAADLGTRRAVSSIPRTAAPGPASCPANHEAETAADAATGNWVYPSEQQFFDAMVRKGHAARAADMRTVVPIHNAVNERAWAEIRAWEAPYARGAAEAPRLHSFAGDSSRMTPRARAYTLLGYAAPFDRHDWVVDRAGTRVEYVIDFYAGRSDRAGDGKLNFYLDVRPKLNTWEGVRMRVAKGLGLV